jgi:tetratricopeptide (TPR) repeat protein
MESYHIAMARKDGSAARKSLEQANNYIDKQAIGTGRWEYELARAEYLFLVEGKAEAAWLRLATVPETFLNSHSPWLKAQILLSRKSFEEAYKKITELLTAEPENIDLQIMQAEAMAGMDAWEALMPHLDSMGDDARGRADYWRLKGFANKRLGSLGQSREDIERAAWMEPFNLHYVIDAGYACTELGEFERSEQHWRRALKLDPFNREALVRLAESREVHHDISAAKALLRECLIHHPDFQTAQEMLLRLDTN